MNGPAGGKLGDGDEVTLEFGDLCTPGLRGTVERLAEGSDTRTIDVAYPISSNGGRISTRSWSHTCSISMNRVAIPSTDRGGR